jgi:ribonuclease P protein component
MPALYEADLSTKQPASQAHARVSRADADPVRARRTFGSPAQGAQKALSVSPGPAVRETFSRDDRLRKRREFEECYASGVRVSGRHLQLFLLARKDAAASRIGISAGKKTGGSVVRNRLKRRLREIFRRNRAGLPPGVQIVINVRPSAAAAAFSEFAEDYVTTLVRGLARLKGGR